MTQRRSARLIFGFGIAIGGAAAGIVLLRRARQALAPPFGTEPTERAAETDAPATERTVKIDTSPAEKTAQAVEPPAEQTEASTRLASAPR